MLTDCACLAIRISWRYWRIGKFFSQKGNFQRVVALFEEVGGKRLFQQIARFLLIVYICDISAKTKSLRDRIIINSGHT